MNYERENMLAKEEILKGDGPVKFYIGDPTSLLADQTEADVPFVETRVAVLKKTIMKDIVTANLESGCYEDGAAQEVWLGNNQYSKELVEKGLQAIELMYQHNMYADIPDAEEWDPDNEDMQKYFTLPVPLKNFVKKCILVLEQEEEDGEEKEKKNEEQKEEVSLKNPRIIWKKTALRLQEFYNFMVNFSSVFTMEEVFAQIIAEIVYDKTPDQILELFGGPPHFTEEMNQEILSIYDL